MMSIFRWGRHEEKFNVSKFFHVPKHKKANIFAAIIGTICIGVGFIGVIAEFVEDVSLGYFFTFKFCSLLLMAIGGLMLRYESHNFEVMEEQEQEDV